MRKRAIASMITEDNYDLELFDDIKPGDSKIELVYYLDGKIDSFGSITVYKNGEMYVDIDEEEYSSIIYSDLAVINGNNPESKIDKVTNGYHMSETPNKERFARMKKFIADNNIELVYSEELSMEEAETEGLTYEEYLDKGKKALAQLLK